MVYWDFRTTVERGMRITYQNRCLQNKRFFLTSLTRNRPPLQVLNESIIGNGQEVGSLSMGAYHIFAQTQGLDFPVGTVGIFPKRTWGWGSNAKGQLGPTAGITDSSPFPSLIPRSNFPKFGFTWESGNRFPLCNFTYYAWDSTTGARKIFQVSIAAGPQSIASLQSTISNGMAVNGHASDAFLFKTNSRTEGAEIVMQRSGYQIDLKLSPFIQEYMGYNYSNKKLPDSGLINEISAKVGNNALVFNRWGGSILISAALGNNRFRFAAWNKQLKAASYYTQTVPDGSYTPSQLAVALNSAIRVATGQTIVLDLGGPNQGIDDLVTLTLKNASLRIVTGGGDTFFAGNNSLGLAASPDFPDPALYGGSTLPNEVSPAAQNNLFHYRVGASVFNVSISAGIYNLSDVEAAINKGMVQNGHPSGVFSIAVDNSSRVVLQITQPGYQALLSGRIDGRFLNNTIGRYLGFIDMDLPCNPAYIVDGLSEQDVVLGRFVPTGPYCIADFAAPSSLDMFSCIESPGDWCGLTVNVTGLVFSKRGAYSRPFVSSFAAAGTCSINEIAGACSCKASISFFASFNISHGNSANKTCNISFCRCNALPYLASLPAVSRWGVCRFNVSVPSLLYNRLNFESINSNFKQYFSSVLQTLDVIIRLDTKMRKLSISLNVTGTEGYQIDLSQSTLTTALDLGLGTIPPNNEFAFAGFCDQQINFCQLFSDTAAWKYLEGGIILDDFSLGRDHTLVKSLDRYSGAVQLYAWGSNQFGQLGTQNNAGLCYEDISNDIVSCAALASSGGAVQTLLRPVSTIDPVYISSSLFSGDQTLSIAAGGLHNLVLTSSGLMWCFGANQHGQCGFDQNADPYSQLANPLPTLVGTRSNGPDNYPPDRISCGPVFNVTLLNCNTSCPGTDSCGKWNFLSKCVKCPFGGIAIDRYSAGLSHSIVQTVDGKFWTFGSNSFGQLLQNNLNLGNQNANPQPEEVNANLFGDGNQPLIDFTAAGDVSLIQSFRPVCAAGNHSVDGRSPCLRCEPGSSGSISGLWTASYTSTDQSIEQPVNFAGHQETYLVTKNLSCDLCPAGQFSSTAGATSCVMCLIGTYSMLGASACHTCPAGTFSDGADAPFTNRTTCHLCSAGQSSYAGTSSCFDCQAGSASTYDGSPACTVCPLGKYSNISAATICLLCATKSYQNQTGGTFCYSCSGNTTTAAPGAYSITQCLSFCEPGQSGSPAPVAGSTLGTLNCKACPAGKFSNSSRQLIDGKGATVCSACAAGIFGYRLDLIFCKLYFNPCA